MYHLFQLKMHNWYKDGKLTHLANQHMSFSSTVKKKKPKIKVAILHNCQGNPYHLHPISNQI